MKLISPLNWISRESWLRCWYTVGWAVSSESALNEHYSSLHLHFKYWWLVSRSPSHPQISSTSEGSGPVTSMRYVDALDAREVTGPYPSLVSEIWGWEGDSLRTSHRYWNVSERVIKGSAFNHLGGGVVVRIFANGFFSDLLWSSFFLTSSDQFFLACMWTFHPLEFFFLTSLFGNPVIIF